MYLDCLPYFCLIDHSEWQSEPINKSVSGPACTWSIRLPAEAAEGELHLVAVAKDATPAAVAAAAAPTNIAASAATFLAAAAATDASYITAATHITATTHIAASAAAVASNIPIAAADIQCIIAATDITAAGIAPKDGQHHTVHPFQLAHPLQRLDHLWGFSTWNWHGHSGTGA